MLIARAGVSDSHAFHKGGANVVRTLQRELLAAYGRYLKDYSRILELGCGSGQTMRHLGYLNATELHGADTDADMVAWCAEHIPYATFRVIQSEPRLPYAAASFDLIFSRADLDENLWRPELDRLAPDGAVVLALDERLSSGESASPDERSSPPIPKALPSMKGYTRHRSWPLPDDAR